MILRFANEFNFAFWKMLRLSSHCLCLRKLGSQLLLLLSGCSKALRGRRFPYNDDMKSAMHLYVVSCVTILVARILTSVYLYCYCTGQITVSGRASGVKHMLITIRCIDPSQEEPKVFDI